MKGAIQMTKLLENGVKIIIGLVIVMIALSIFISAVKFLFKVAIFAAVGCGIYIGAKKIGLIKGR